MISTASTMIANSNTKELESNSIGIDLRQQRPKKAKHLGPKLITIKGMIKRQ